MQFFFIVLIICLVIFLFSLYTFAHDDFILLRRNVSTDDVFNYAFLISLVSLLFSRVFFVLFHPKPVFLNPLGFILFPYFPGLSLTGAVVGGIFFLAILFRKKNFPIGRIFDFFSLALLSAMPIGFIGYILLSSDHSIPTILELVAYSIILIFSVIFLTPKFLKSGKEDGIIGLIFLISFSIISIIHNLLIKVSENLKVIDFGILIAIFFVSVLLLLRKVFKTNLLKK